MKSSLDKDDPTTDYLRKGEAEIGPSKEGERVQDVEKNHMRSKNVLQRKLSVTIANEKDTMDPNASLKICRKLQQLSLMQKEAFGILHFLDTVSNSGEKSWLISIKVNNIDVKFKLDTGAEVTAISEETFQLLNNCTLSHPEKNLYGPSRQPLEVLGKFEGKFAYDNKSTIQPVYVVNKLKMNLLGLPAITSLNLATRIDSVEYYSKGIMEKYPSVFNGLGNLGDEYEIVLEQNAKPFSLYTPRSIPIPLRAKVKKELERMESMGVISKVDEPTPWCAGMVAVQKKMGLFVYAWTFSI